MISQVVIDKVLSKAQETASHSWEYGTVFEALLEYRDPHYSIFHDPFPGGKIPELTVEGVEALRYVKPFIQTNSARLCEGNGSSSDPTSLCIPALLLYNSTTSQAPDNPYLSAVNRQLHDLLSTTPRYSNGAISHRDAYPSLWADFVYMVPPALAYHGVFTSDIGMVKESVRQCQLYCEVLSTSKGYWRHIVNAEGTGSVKSDDGAWCTSNAWAAAGMARVLATLRKSQYGSETADEQKMLLNMTKGILDGAIEADTDASGLLRNYLDNETWFPEVAGTALMAATAFRMALLEPGTFGERYVGWATCKLESVSRYIDEETGVAAPVVNSLKEGQRTPLNGINPEGQAFVVLLYAAWRDRRTVAEDASVPMAGTDASRT
ncbi:hypothetical protein J4E93_004644 [Alternaria ventricosa]|uniref:uncharacterized protein n=1 Tax=Alternaria ventricosa TaxID=1187951 RepID=UPI0020C2F98F|nr:uncharacterized protein J4E93_004644 [Alternaria ventricosa]KAI4648232.1 hypothetical protein J4E93_004644 [Alternaria ventricosa]